MGILLTIGLYFVIWWVVLFAILPFGVRSQEEMDNIAPGTEPAAPTHPLLLYKVIATSIVTLIIIGIVHLVYNTGIITPEGVTALFGLDFSPVQ